MATKISVTNTTNTTTPLSMILTKNAKNDIETKQKMTKTKEYFETMKKCVLLTQNEQRKVIFMTELFEQMLSYENLNNIHDYSITNKKETEEFVTRMLMFNRNCLAFIQNMKFTNNQEEECKQYVLKVMTNIVYQYVKYIQEENKENEHDDDVYY